jgi:hypothetical protein
MMPSNQEEVLVGIRFNGSAPNKAEFDKAIERVKVLIKYESIYKEKFVYDSINQMQKQQANAN